MNSTKNRWLERKIDKTDKRWEKKKILSATKPALGLKRGDMVTGKVYNVTDDGAFIVTPENYKGFIHKDEMTQQLELETKVEARVTFVRDDGKLNLSIRPIKEVGRVQDAEKIIEFMKKRKGSMPYSDQSPPDIIKDVFGLSKASFKRALGKLLKDGRVEQKDGWVTLKDMEE